MNKSKDMTDKERTEQLRYQVIDKINLLNRIQIDRMDQFKSILMDNQEHDLRFLEQVLDKELSKYPDYFEYYDKVQSTYKAFYKGFKEDEMTNRPVDKEDTFDHNYRNNGGEFTDGNGY